VAANIAAIPIVQPPQPPQPQVAVPVVVPIVEEPVVVTPIAVKNFKSEWKVFFNLGKSWIPSKERNSLVKYVKDFSLKNEIVDISVAGFTQPTLVNPNPQKLSADRAKAVAKALRALGVNAKISAAGKGNTRINKPTSRFALITITATPKT
jgi:outer membrane protein OmpA-like peptidoglycan-associated protein